MHELGTIYYVMKTVENLAAENKLTKVGSITLEVGEVSGIVPEFLTDFWEYARKKARPTTPSPRGRSVPTAAAGTPIL